MLQSVLQALALPDLRRRILFTLGMLLAFRFIAHVPVPNIDPNALESLRQSLQTNQLAQLLNIFAGGALQNLSVAAMGVYPYITAQIIVQLLQPLIPALDELRKEGEQGRVKLNKITFYATIPMAFLQAYGQTLTLDRSLGVGQSLFRTPFDIVNNFLPTFTILVAMVAGSMLLVWLGEQIQQYGIGNGISVIIFAGIVSGLPGLIIQAFTTVELGGIEQAIARGATAHPGTVRQARARQPGVWRAEQPYSAQGEHGRHDPADLRPEHHHLPGHDRLVWLPRAGGAA
jgi:preprotein translocase subunit SecY